MIDKNTGERDPADTVLKISDVRCTNGHADISYVPRGRADFSHSPYYNYIHEGVPKGGRQRSMRGSLVGIKREIKGKCPISKVGSKGGANRVQREASQKG